MKADTIKVGAKSKSKREQLRLSYRRPENVGDCETICAGNGAAVAALFNRGYTIWLQDRFGRPMFEENKSAEEIQKAFDTAVPGVTKGFSQPAAPIAVKLTPGKKSYTPEEFAALLKSQGIVVVPE